MSEAPLLSQVRACRLCAPGLPLGPRPILQYHPQARILLASQAPGRRAHGTGIPFTDASGDRLRTWLGLEPEVFYDPLKVAILPMAFCYPGTGPTGDRPPPPLCAQTWRTALLAPMDGLRLTLVIGAHALAYHLPGLGPTVTEAVRAWRALQPGLMPLPHPSPRNNLWLRRNPWFEGEVLPVLRQRVTQALTP